VRILFDLCSREGVQKYLGVEDLASSVLYAKADWISANRESVARIVRATNRASDWARSHSTGEIRGFLPASTRTDDAAVDADAIGSMVATMSPDGRFRPEHLDVAREILTVSDPSLRIRTADVSHSYTNEFFKSEVR
jgi:NitT/TauT family transport system substrate-binding protein